MIANTLISTSLVVTFHDLFTILDNRNSKFSTFWTLEGLKRIGPRWLVRRYRITSIDSPGGIILRYPIRGGITRRGIIRGANIRGELIEVIRYIMYVHAVVHPTCGLATGPDDHGLAGVVDFDDG